MPDRLIHVGLHRGRDRLTLQIPGGGFFGCRGADAVLDLEEANRLRNALNAAIDVGNRERGLADARARLDRINGEIGAGDERPGEDEDSGGEEAGIVMRLAVLERALATLREEGRTVSIVAEKSTLEQRITALEARLSSVKGGE